MGHFCVQTTMTNFLWDRLSYFRSMNHLYYDAIHSLYKIIVNNLSSIHAMHKGLVEFGLVPRLIKTRPVSHAYFGFPML